MDIRSGDSKSFLLCALCSLYNKRKPFQSRFWLPTGYRLGQVGVRAGEMGTLTPRSQQQRSTIICIIMTTQSIKRRLPLAPLLLELNMATAACRRVVLLSKLCDDLDYTRFMFSRML